jgi:very-short-patch-repair endonuclease
LKQKFGLKIIRYINEEVSNNTEKVTEDLIRKIEYINPTPLNPPLSGGLEILHVSLP